MPSWWIFLAELGNSPPRPYACSVTELNLQLSSQNPWISSVSKDRTHSSVYGARSYVGHDIVKQYLPLLWDFPAFYRPTLLSSSLPRDIYPCHLLTQESNTGSRNHKASYSLQGGIIKRCHIFTNWLTCSPAYGAGGKKKKQQLLHSVERILPPAEKTVSAWQCLA